MKRPFQFAMVLVLTIILAACRKSGVSATIEEDVPVLLRLEVAHANGDTSYSRIYLVP